MSIIGILASNLFSSGAQAAGNTQNTSSTQNTPSKFGQIATEFQQLGQDLQSGNLTQAQQDFTTLSQNLTSVGATTNNANSSLPAVQAFTQLGSDLQSGNLQAAQQDFSNVQQDLQQGSQSGTGQVHHHHHRHHHGGGAQSASSGNSSQQSAINTDFGNLAHALQSGNLSGAQSAFATLAADLQQIGGFSSSGAGGSSTTGATVAGTSGTGSVNVTA